MKLKIKKGDTVQLITGADKGKEGRVLEVYPSKMKLLVEGVNQKIKHEKPSQQNQTGGRVTVSAPVHYSNVKKID
ncbi:50S ribosomal protein L24 [bacterium]|nr:MAG: 50S ribosomal protein L24 [bacterium]